MPFNSAADTKRKSQKTDAGSTAISKGRNTLIVPRDVDDRQRLFKSLAFDATVYGLPAYLQYKEMYRQAIDRASASYSGFNAFVHERNLAGPGYAAFKVPNSDTLYSTAWIDLSRSPVEIFVPPVGLKYYTLNIFDMFGNPSNLGTRTIGSGGGRFLLVSPTWKGKIPRGLTLFRGSTPHLWVLMRVFAQTESEIAQAHRFQDDVKILPRGERALDQTPIPVPPAPGTTAADFFRALDFILCVDHHLPGEDALVARFQALGLLGAGDFDPTILDRDSLEAMAQGHQEAMTLTRNARPQLGTSTSAGWMRVEKGSYGFNYLRRAVTNLAGLGANVPEENSSFTTFVDERGVVLDGAACSYRLKLTKPPLVDAFWSVTLYDARTFELFPNSMRRYLISDRTSGLKIAADGSIDIAMQHGPAMEGNWLPAPQGPFFVVIRSYLPRPEMLNGEWLPPPIRREPSPVDLQ